MEKKFGGCAALTLVAVAKHQAKQAIYELTIPVVFRTIA